MKAWLFVRAASSITLLYCAGHMAGMPWTPVTRPQETALLEIMKSDRFEVMGNLRTYWDFYIGFGIIIGGFLALQAVILWQMASLARANPKQAHPILAVFLVSFLANAAIAWKYFFPIPVILATATSLCLGVALMLLRREIADNRS